MLDCIKRLLKRGYGRGRKKRHKIRKNHCWKGTPICSKPKGKDDYEEWKHEGITKRLIKSMKKSGKGVKLKEC